MAALVAAEPVPDPDEASDRGPEDEREQRAACGIAVADLELTGERVAARVGTRAGVLVGTVDGTDAYIAIVSDGSAVAGYACDGQQFSRCFVGIRCLCCS